MLPTPSKIPWFEQGSSFISLEDIMVSVQFTPRQRAFMVLRFAETHIRSLKILFGPAWSLFTKILASSFIKVLLEIVPDRNRGLVVLSQVSF